MRRSAARIAAGVTACFLTAWTLAPAVFAQSCAMCYTTAKAQNPQGIRALNSAILVLMIPTLALFIGFFVLLYRRRNAQRVEGASEPEELGFLSSVRTTEELIPLS
jgi:hypothetical protein